MFSIVVEGFTHRRKVLGIVAQDAPLVHRTQIVLLSHTPTFCYKIINTTNVFTIAFFPKRNLYLPNYESRNRWVVVYIAFVQNKLRGIGKASIYLPRFPSAYLRNELSNIVLNIERKICCSLVTLVYVFSVCHCCVAY